MNAALHSEDLKLRARRAYERGRLRAALFASLCLTTALALLGVMLVGPRAAVWAPLTFVLWTWLGWRGGPLLRGARYGVAAGALTFVLPLSVLRPCCRWSGMTMASCTMPEMCVALGAIVGLPMSAWALSRRESRPVEVGVGMWLGVVSAASFKCSALFAGEALGLLGGVALGMLAAGAMGAVNRQRTSPGP